MHVAGVHEFGQLLIHLTDNNHRTNHESATHVWCAWFVSSLTTELPRGVVQQVVLEEVRERARNTARVLVQHVQGLRPRCVCGVVFCCLPMGGVSYTRCVTGPWPASSSGAPSNRSVGSPIMAVSAESTSILVLPVGDTSALRGSRGNKRTGGRRIAICNGQWNVHSVPRCPSAQRQVLAETIQAASRRLWTASRCCPWAETCAPYAATVPQPHCPTPYLPIHPALPPPTAPPNHTPVPHPATCTHTPSPAHPGHPHQHEHRHSSGVGVVGAGWWVGDTDSIAWCGWRMASGGWWEVVGDRWSWGACMVAWWVVDGLVVGCWPRCGGRCVVGW